MTRALFDAVGEGRLILTPNTEIAAALHDAVERHHVAAGLDVWPTPRIRDFTGWLRERQTERQFRDARAARTLSDVEERELWREAVADSVSSRLFLEPAGAARAARRAHTALFEYGIPLEAVANYDADEARAFLDWNLSFERRCRDLNCTGAARLLAGIEALAQPLAWVDSPLWRPVARRWLRSQNALKLSPASLGDCALLTSHAASPVEELAAIGDWARRGLEAEPGFRAWICIPDLMARRAQVQDALDAVLVPARFSLEPRGVVAPYAIAGGTPLAEFPSVRIALRLLAASTGVVTFDEFAALLRSPELTEGSPDATAAARLELELRRRGPHQAELKSWLRLCDTQAATAVAARAAPSAAVQRLRAAYQILDGAPLALAMSQWVPLWIKALEAGPWCFRARWSSVEFQAAERLREVLSALATGDAVFGARSAAAAYRLLSRAAADTPYQEQTGIPGVWVTAQVMDPWLPYDGVWVAGCDDRRWPPPIDPIPLLPVRVQQDYGVVAAGVGTQLAFAENLQARWQSRAASAVFSFADAADGRGAVASPLLPRVAARSAAQSTVTQPHWHRLWQAAPRLESLLDERAPVFDATSERTRGTATLKGQSRCAFRGFAETRLRTATLDRPVPGFNERERGELLHHALEWIWSDLATSARLAALSAEELAQVVRGGAAHALAHQCVQRDPGLRWRRREFPRLQNVLHKWLATELLREPFEVERLEQQTASAHFGGLEYQVRIDRVDRLANGGCVVIDYKTGVATADWRGDRPDNPQLPIYALLRPAELVAVAYGRVNAGDCSFVSEAERDGIFKARGRRSALEGQSHFADLIALWSQRIEAIARQFAEGDAAVAPTLKACASCDLQPLCRVPPALADPDESLHD